jgi:hypothetical protein
MFQQKKKIQNSFEQMLKEVENTPSLYVELTDAEVAEIVGGAYMKAISVTPTRNGEVCMCICNQSMCNFGACDDGPDIVFA